MRVCLPCCSVKSQRATLQQRVLPLAACMHAWKNLMSQAKPVLSNLPEQVASGEGWNFFLDASQWRAQVSGCYEPVSKLAHDHLLHFSPPVSIPGLLLFILRYSSPSPTSPLPCRIWLALLVLLSFQTIGTPCFKKCPSNSLWPCRSLKWELLGASTQTFEYEASSVSQVLALRW